MNERWLLLRTSKRECLNLGEPPFSGGEPFLLLLYAVASPLQNGLRTSSNIVFVVSCVIPAAKDSFRACKTAEWVFAQSG